MNEQSSSAPAPSKHVFLHELSKQPNGSKVRFLCCVLEYEVERGRLHVEHAYPHDAVPTPSAHVDIDLVLESLNDATLRNGAWLNVIGYVKNGEGTRMKRRKSTKDNKTDSPEILVQAILIWDAGSVNVDIYEKTIEMNRQALRDARKVHQRCIGDKSLPK